MAPEAITSFCRERLAGYQVPKRVIRVDALPRGAGGKLLKDVSVFDVFRREGQTSLGVRLEFRAGDRTLSSFAVRAR